MYKKFNGFLKFKKHVVDFREKNFHLKKFFWSFFKFKELDLTGNELNACKNMAKIEKYLLKASH